MEHTKEFIASLTGLPRFAVTSEEHIGRLTVVHKNDGAPVAIYEGAIGKAVFHEFQDLSEGDYDKINTKLKERKIVTRPAWTWPTAETMAQQQQPPSDTDTPPIQKAVALNCWPFPVTYEVAEPDAEEEKRADAEIAVEHEIDLLQDKNVCAKRIAEVIALFDAWMPQRTLHVHDDLNDIAAEALQPPYALTHAQHIVYDTYQENVKVIVTYDATQIYYRLARSSANGKYWYYLWIFGTSTADIKCYSNLGPDLLKLNARESDLEFAQKVDAGIGLLIDAVYKAAE